MPKCCANCKVGMFGHEPGDLCRTCTGAYLFGLMRGESKERAKHLRTGWMYFLAGMALGAAVTLAVLEIGDGLGLDWGAAGRSSQGFQRAIRHEQAEGDGNP